MFTVIGSSGFVGRHLVNHLKEQGIECFTPTRNDPSLFSRSLGHLIYCAGYTADFRSKMLETVEAHVCHLRQIITYSTFDSLLYLSSTRVYQRATETHEDVPLSVTPHDPSDLYNISKLMGESLCLSVKRPNMRVVRLSNVYGHEMGQENFLGALIHEAVEKKEILLKTSLNSSKDYIFVNDLLPILIAIAKNGEERLYNLASGYNISNEKIVKQLASLTGCSLKVAPNPIESHFPAIMIARIQKEFGFIPTLLEEALPQLLSSLDVA